MLTLIAAAAAAVTGAMGYGFSTIAVPSALLVAPGRVLNPAVVAIEIALNAGALVIHRRHVAAVWPRVRSLVLGVPIGVVVGAGWLSRVEPTTARVVVYLVILAWLFVQTLGVLQPVAIKGITGPIVGSGLGLLHAMTTISGPPLAILLARPDLQTRERLAGMAIVRLGEGVVTVLAYRRAGLVGRDSLALLTSMWPGVLIGLPFGAWAFRRVDADVSRRVSLGVAAWIIAFGLAAALPKGRASVLAAAPFVAALAITRRLAASGPAATGARARGGSPPGSSSTGARPRGRSAL